MKNTPSLIVLEEKKSLLFSKKNASLSEIDKKLKAAGYNLYFAHFINFFTSKPLLKMSVLAISVWLLTTFVVMLQVMATGDAGFSLPEIFLFSAALSIVSPVILFFMSSNLFIGEGYLVRSKAKALMKILFKENGISLNEKRFYEDPVCEDIHSLIQDLSGKYEIASKYDYDFGYAVVMARQYYYSPIKFFMERVIGKHKENSFVNFGFMEAFSILVERGSENFAKLWIEKVVYGPSQDAKEFLEDFLFLVVLSEKIEQKRISFSGGFVECV